MFRIFFGSSHPIGETLTPITFDADGTIASEVDDSDTDGAFFDDCNDSPDGVSADWIGNDVSETTTTAWLRLADVDSDFDSMDTFRIEVDVDSTGFADDTCALTIRIADGDQSSTWLTDSQEIATEADSSRTQRTVTFGSLTGSKAQWDTAHALLTWTYSKTGGPDNAQVRIYGAEFTGSYTAAVASTAAPTHAIGRGIRLGISLGIAN